MWKSIRKVIFPKSLEEACVLSQYKENSFFAGGTYLVSEKKSTISTLININRLLDKSITINQSGVRIGAGVTLQQIVDSYRNDGTGNIVQSAKWSCPSKNIRNQRTIGGEIAQRRTNSELLCYLWVLDVKLEIFMEKKKTVALREWDGQGIIKALEIETQKITSSAIERFSLLPSATAFVIVTGSRSDSACTVVVGGKTSQFTFQSFDHTKLSNDEITAFSSTAIQHFKSDQYGSLEYKEQLIRTGLRRISEEL